jgi:acyl-CoA thioester hydrolase
MTYRSPAFYGETLMVESRVDRIGRTSFGMVHRITAPESRYGRARLVAVSDSTLVSYDYGEERPIPVPEEWRAAFEAFEGKSLG